MQHALELLGFPCYHGVTLMANLRDTEMWNAALDAKYFGIGQMFTRSDWDQLLGPYSAVTDLPAIAFAEDLIKAYPEAKVILIERDIEKWYVSFNEGLIAPIWNPILPLVARLDTQFVGRMAGTAMRWTRGWMRANSRREMQENARRKYREHYVLVESVTPPEQLLMFELSQGWRPLCEFLDVPVPDVDFPHVNESAALKEKIGLIMRRGYMNVLKVILKVLVPAVISILIWRMLPFGMRGGQ